MTARFLTAPLDRAFAGLLELDEDFTQPAGEPSLVGPGAVSWRVFANPVALYIGGIAGVLLELAEPRVRHGVWDHSSFRRDPGRRLRRTGQAALVTVFGARSRFEALAARVRKMHAHVAGTTPGGLAYAASDPELLLWVQVTAAWGFLEAYARYVRLVSPGERDAYYAEGQASAALYGVATPPRDEAEVGAVFARMAPRLGPSPILHELIAILKTGPILPPPLRPLQPVVVRAAIDLLPRDLRQRIGIAGERRLRTGERMLLQALARAADQVRLPSSPAVQAAARMAAARAPDG